MGRVVRKQSGRGVAFAAVCRSGQEGLREDGTEDGYIKFALLTGVTKFGKVNVFSDLNNLYDISMDEKYFDICGISEKELVDDFSDDIRTLADCPYEMAKDVELHYQNVLFIVFRLAGLYTEVEYHTSRSRVDLVLQTPDYVYVMVFKLDGSAEEVMRQIEEKQYALPFAKDGRKVYCIGVNFSSETRNIDRWIVK